MEGLRIGVFVCHCGTNIAGFLDTRGVAEYAGTLPDVVLVKENLFSCSQSGVTEIQKAIKENQLNRVVVAACTPRTHEPTFRSACEDAGLNPFFFEFVNIREHCSWVHKGMAEEATHKAKDLVRMGVARARYLEPKEPIVADVEPAALVIGGGISGLTAALSLANRGIEVKLVEREEELGGMLRKLFKLYPSNIDAREFIARQVEAVEGHPRIEVFTSSTVEGLRGYIGNYRATISSQGVNKREVHVGVIIVATGAAQLDPTEMYGYDGKRVISHLELEERLRNGELGAKNIVFIKCVGARVPERLYCSRICCMTSIKNAILIKEKDPEARVHILYRDLMCYGLDNEALLRKAKELGVRFVNYSLQRPPIMENGKVRVYSDILGKEIGINTELVVLVTPMVSQDGVEELSRLLKVPLDGDRFFLEAHVKLRPLDFATDGIYLCGTAHWPASVSESIEQALGAAARASTYLINKRVTVEPIFSMLLDEDLCRGCGLCASLCPYGAIDMVQTEKGIKAQMIAVACKGCGTCGASCYRRAIKMNHYTDEQLIAQVRAAFSG